LRLSREQEASSRTRGGDRILSEQEFRTALERLIEVYLNDTYEEWREAMHLLAADTSPEQCEEVVGRLAGSEHSAIADAPVVRERERVLAADEQTV
jgi:hypothetical protein